MPPFLTARALITLPCVDANVKASIESWGGKKCCLSRTSATSTELRILLQHRSKQHRSDKDAKYALASLLGAMLKASGSEPPSRDRRAAPWIRVLSEQEFEQLWAEEAEAASSSLSRPPPATEPQRESQAMSPCGGLPAEPQEEASPAEPANVDGVTEADVDNAWGTGNDALSQLTVDASCVRKTNESPPSVSVYDAIALLMRWTNPRRVRIDLQATVPEFVRLAYNLESPGQRQREIRLKLDTWGYKKPPVDWGTKGCEFRVGPSEGILDAIDA